MTTQVEIISETECKSLNPLQKPSDNIWRRDPIMFQRLEQDYEQAESKREVYKIDFEESIIRYGDKELFALKDLSISTTHTAELNLETKQAIIL